MGGQGEGKEFSISNIGVLVVVQMLLKAFNDLFSNVRINVIGFQFFREILNDLALRG